MRSLTAGATVVIRQAMRVSMKCCYDHKQLGTINYSLQFVVPGCLSLSFLLLIIINQSLDA